MEATENFRILGNVYQVVISATKEYKNQRKDHLIEDQEIRKTHDSWI